MTKTESIKKEFKLLPLDIQFFSEDPGTGDPGNDPDDSGTKDPGAADKNDPDPGAKDEKTFTEAEVQQMIKDQLAAAQKKQQEEADRKKLEEEGKLQELLEIERKKREELENTIKQKEQDELKTSAILAAGYSAEQVEFVKGIVKGETEDEIKTSLEAVKQHVEPKGSGSGADPSPGNSGRQKPGQQSGEEVGRSLYQQIKSKRRRR